MIDINLIRDNPKLVKDNIKKKSQDPNIVDEIIKKDEEWRKLKSKVDDLRSERNKISLEINKIKKAGKDDPKLMRKAREIPAKIAELGAKAEAAYNSIFELMLIVPNIMHKDVPKGKDGTKNKEIRKVGKTKKGAKNHVEVLEKLNLVDFDSSAKVAGNGFYYMKGDLGLLNQSLIRFTIDFMTGKDYTYIEGPLMLNGKAIYASMDKAAIQDSVYSIEGEDLNLIGTSEQSLLAMHANEVIKELPKKYFSYSMCFRKEIGAHGINEKGLWRTHHFNKIEQFAFCKPEDSEKTYNEMMKTSEEIMKKLGLPYRMIEICTGDLSDWKHRSHDIEVYRPTTNEYGEVMSLSNCTDYQARKLNVKYLDKEGNRKVVHTLNNTVLATSRILVAIVENYQNKDGTITVPKVLVPYMNGKIKIGG